MENTINILTSVLLILILPCCADFEETVINYDQNTGDNNLKFYGSDGHSKETANEQLPFIYANKEAYANPFYIRKDNKTIFKLLSPAVHINGNWYRAEEGSLKWYKNKTVTGWDRLGSYVKQQDFYYAGKVTFITSITRYPKNPSFVLFGQEFPDGAEMSFTGSPMDTTMSAFPVFVRKQLDVDLGYLAYGGIMAGDTNKNLGKWSNTKAPIEYGLYSGPLALFDYNLTNTFLVSPFDQFMAVSTMFNKTENSVSYGIMGNASHVPPGFRMETMMYYGTKGINQVFHDWGTLMRTKYERSDKYVKSDFTNNYLGYWMDGGAFYSYKSEPNKTMEETVLDMKAQSLREKVPYRYVEFDEWFYCQCEGEPLVGCCDGVGTELWVTAQGVFPGGFKNLSDRTKWPVHGSNKWWSHTTPYAKQNGGEYTFLVDNARKGALPVDQCFWDYLMNMAKQRGQIVYEQDFQSTQFEHLWQLTSNITLGRTWYTQMGKGAELNGIAIQYCMAPSRTILQGLEIPTVTQARASGDYRPGYGNWRIGISSLFLNAVGIRAFKDNFWTTTNQTDYNFGKYYETQLDLVNLVATMSMGPVGPSDKINCTDPVGLMKCCNQEGLILQPSYPPTAIDVEMRDLAFNPSIANEIWSTASIVSGSFFGIIIASDVKHQVKLRPSDVFSHLTDTSVFDNSAVFRNDSSNGALMITKDFSDGSPILVTTSCTPTAPCVYYSSPRMLLGSGTSATSFYLLGELAKWTPVSSKRIQMISIEDGEVYITIMGMPTETVELSYIVGSQLMSHKCTIPEWGHVVLQAIAKKCN